MLPLRIIESTAQIAGIAGAQAGEIVQVLSNQAKNISPRRHEEHEDKIIGGFNSEVQSGIFVPGLAVYSFSCVFSSLVGLKNA